MFRDLNRYVIKKHAADWKDIGIELGLSFSEIKSVGMWRGRNRFGDKDSFRQILNDWLGENSDATWKAVEIALTNVNRLNLKLNPVDDLYAVDDNDVPTTNSE